MKQYNPYQISKKKPGYRISFNDISTRHGIAKLEHDGFTREDIMKSVHRHTEGASVDYKRDLVKTLFDRKEK